MIKTEKNLQNIKKSLIFKPSLGRMLDTPERNFKLVFFLKKEVRNATEAHIALMRGSPYVPRTLQMQLMRINICRVLRRWNQFI